MADYYLQHRKKSRPREPSCIRFSSPKLVDFVTIDQWLQTAINNSIRKMFYFRYEPLLVSIPYEIL